MTIKLRKFIESVKMDFDTARDVIGVLGDLVNTSEDNMSHKGYTVFDHIKRVFENGIFFVEFVEITLGKDLCFTERSRDIFLLKCLLHDIGKINTGAYINGHKLFVGHELTRRDMAVEILLKFDLTSNEVEEILEFVGTHTDIQICLDGGVKEFENRFKEFSSSHICVRDYVLFALSDLHNSYLETSKPGEYLYRVHTLLNAAQNLIV